MSSCDQREFAISGLWVSSRDQCEFAISANKNNSWISLCYQRKCVRPGLWGSSCDQLVFPVFGYNNNLWVSSCDWREFVNSGFKNKRCHEKPLQITSSSVWYFDATRGNGCSVRRTLTSGYKLKYKMKHRDTVLETVTKQRLRWNEEIFNSWQMNMFCFT